MTKTSQKLPLIIGLNAIIDILLLDQVSKWWIITRIYIGDGHDPNFLTWLFSKAPQFDMPVDPVTPFFNMVMVWNQGVSFGLLNTGVSAMVLSTLSLLIAGFFVMWLATAKRVFPAISAGMIVGGAIGNVWDRLRFSAVADFFDFHYAGYHWPAFNIADAAIVIGVTFLVIDTLFFDHKNDETLYSNEN